MNCGVYEKVYKKNKAPTLQEFIVSSWEKNMYIPSLIESELS